MQRMTVTLPEKLCDELDTFAASRQYATRSEAMRDLLRGVVMHGNLTLIAIELQKHAHEHGEESTLHTHLHVKDII